MRFQSRSANLPTRRALSSALSATANRAMATATAALPITAAVVSSGWDSPPIARNTTAATEKITFANAFQTVVAALPTVTCSTVNPQRRSIEYEIAMPTASPPGSTLAAAVEACESTSECPNDRPGKAAIQGGPNVRRLRIATAMRLITPNVLSPVMASHTSP